MCGCQVGGCGGAKPGDDSDPTNAGKIPATDEQQVCSTGKNENNKHYFINANYLNFVKKMREIHGVNWKPVLTEQEAVEQGLLHAIPAAAAARITTYFDQEVVAQSQAGFSNRLSSDSCGSYFASASKTTSIPSPGPKTMQVLIIPPPPEQVFRSEKFGEQQEVAEWSSPGVEVAAQQDFQDHFHSGEDYMSSRAVSSSKLRQSGEQLGRQQIAPSWSCNPTSGDLDLFEAPATDDHYEQEQLRSSHLQADTTSSSYPYDLYSPLLSRGKLPTIPASPSPSELDLDSNLSSAPNSREQSMMSVLSGGGGYYTCIDSARGRGGGGTAEASGVAGAAESSSPSALEIDLFEEPLFTPLDEDAAAARTAQQGCVEEQELQGSSTLVEHQLESRSNSHESTVPSLSGDLLASRTSTSRQPCTREGSLPEQQGTSGAPAATQPTTSGLLLEDNDDFWTTASSSSNSGSSSLTDQQKQELFQKLTGTNQKFLSGVITSANLFQDDSEDDQDEHVSVSKQASAASVYGGGAGAPVHELQQIHQGQGDSSVETLKERIEREYSTGRTTSGTKTSKKLLDPAQLCPSNGSAKTNTTYTSTAIGSAYQKSDCSSSAISIHSVSASQDPSGRREKFLSGASLFTDHSGDDDRQLMLGTSFCSEGANSACGSGGGFFSSEGSLVAGGTTAVVTSSMQNSSTLFPNQRDLQHQQQQLCDSTSSCGTLGQPSFWARTITPASTAAKSCGSAEELPEFSIGTSTGEVVKQQEKEPKVEGDKMIMKHEQIMPEPEQEEHRPGHEGTRKKLPGKLRVVPESERKFAELANLLLKDFSVPAARGGRSRNKAAIYPAGGNISAEGQLLLQRRRGGVSFHRGELLQRDECALQQLQETAASSSSDSNNLTKQLPRRTSVPSCFAFLHGKIRKKNDTSCTFKQGPSCPLSPSSCKERGMKQAVGCDQENQKSSLLGFCAADGEDATADGANKADELCEQMLMKTSGGVVQQAHGTTQAEAQCRSLQSVRRDLLHRDDQDQLQKDLQLAIDLMTGVRDVRTWSAERRRGGGGGSA